MRAKLRKKYQTPKHPWQRARLGLEAKLRQEYAYKNKREVWKMFSILRNFRAQARKLIGLRGPQAEKEKQELFSRLRSLGLLGDKAELDDVLNLTIHDIMERRLQTILVRKKMALTMKQARQMITHGHIMIGDKIVRSPSHLVTLEEEKMIRYNPRSPFANELHPERQKLAEKIKKEAMATEAKAEEGKGEMIGG